MYMKGGGHQILPRVPEIKDPLPTTSHHRKKKIAPCAPHRSPLYISIQYLYTLDLYAPNRALARMRPLNSYCISFSITVSRDFRRFPAISHILCFPALLVAQQSSNFFVVGPFLAFRFSRSSYVRRSALAMPGGKITQRK